MKRILGILTICLLSHPAFALSEQWMCGQISSATIVGGSGYLPSTAFSNRTFSGGTGSDLTATVKTNENGVVNYVLFGNQGHDYTVGDTLTTRLGSQGSGFQLIVTGIINIYYDTQGKPAQNRFPGRKATWITSPCKYVVPPKGQ